MNDVVKKANMAAAKWALVWQPLFSKNPTPWRLEEHEETLLVKDAEGFIVLQYNENSHPNVQAEDRRHNAEVLVKTINNF